MSKKNLNKNKNTTDGNLKRVHTEVSDSTSSDEESTITNVKNIKKLKVASLQTWPRFLVIGSSDDESLRKLSPFAIQKGLAGEPKSVKKVKEWFSFC